MSRKVLSNIDRSKVQYFNEDNILKFDEITRLISILRNIGIVRIRLIGGEPGKVPRIQKNSTYQNDHCLVSRLIRRDNSYCY
jgi:hypothetical protein